MKVLNAHLTAFIFAPVNGLHFLLQSSAYSIIPINALFESIPFPFTIRKTNQKLEVEDQKSSDHYSVWIPIWKKTNYFWSSDWVKSHWHMHHFSCRLNPALFNGSIFYSSHLKNSRRIGCVPRGAASRFLVTVPDFLCGFNRRRPLSSNGWLLQKKNAML